ncbi:MAG: hypothetical protein EU518_01515 [Promethearchaeota archaeon]|nr:MAG: hypothetical protein EU518_01515 [Candidatus Lokiarchaeota archaeon]
MIVSITHEVDLDGLGSQAIIKRYYEKKLGIVPEEISLYYAHYTNFKQRINEIFDNSIPESLIITDIGFNKDYKEIFPLFKKLINKNCKIYWFDHHLIDIAFAEELIHTIELYYNDFQKCSAEIVKDFYLPEDQIANEIAQFAHETDFGINQSKKAIELQSIISFNRGKKNDQNKKKIVKLLSNGEYENKWFSEELRKSEKWQKSEQKRIEKNIQLIEINNFGELILSYAKMSAGSIAKYLKQYYPDKNGYLGIDQRYDELVLYSTKINCRNIAVKFDGGGHKNRAGFKFDKISIDTNIKKQFLEILISEIKNNLI